MSAIACLYVGWGQITNPRNNPNAVPFTLFCRLRLFALTESRHGGAGGGGAAGPADVCQPVPAAGHAGPRGSGYGAQTTPKSPLLSPRCLTPPPRDPPYMLPPLRCEERPSDCRTTSSIFYIYFDVLLLTRLCWPVYWNTLSSFELFSWC